MKVTGLDFSLTSTGVAVIERDGTGHLHRVTSTGKAGATLLERRRRIRALAHDLAELGRGSDLWVLEGPSLGQARQGGQFDRAGLWWLTVEAIAYLSTAPIVEVPPSVRAKYATGSGNAGKDAVLAAVVRRYPTWEVQGNDTADGLVLAAMGRRHLGLPIDSLPAVHLTAMNGVRWPLSATESAEQAQAGVPGPRKRSERRTGPRPGADE